MTALAQRIIAAAVLVPLVVAAVLWLPTPGFALVVAVFALAGAHEWTRIGTLGIPVGAGFVTLVAGSLVVGYLLIHRAPVIHGMLVVSVLWWMLALCAVVGFQRQGQLGAFDSRLARFVGGWLVLVPTWTALVWLHAQRPSLVMYVLLLIWIADTAAYFVGRRFGRRKLASRVSPGKSWEGVAGALFAVALLGALAAMGSNAGLGATAGFVALSLAVTLAGVLGDLVESLFKRRAGMKDSGSLIPGHGGVLDRIDGLTAAAPCFAAGWVFVGGLS